MLRLDQHTLELTEKRLTSDIFSYRHDKLRHWNHDYQLSVEEQIMLETLKFKSVIKYSSYKKAPNENPGSNNL